MITIKTEIQEFIVPDFVYPVAKVGKRQDGFSLLPTIPLGDLDEETLRDLCMQFREDVFEKARKQRGE